MKAFLKQALVVAASLYALVCVLVYLGQRRLLYFPGPSPTTTPDVLGFPWRDAAIETSDGERLGAWMIEPSDPLGVVLMSHGNAGNIAGRLPIAHAFLKMGLSVLLYDYRGYGDSSGAPSEDGTYADAEAAYSWLCGQGWDGGRIVLYGESLGGGVAIELALRVRSAAVIVDHTFTSATDIGADVYPWLPVRLLARDRYDSISKIERVPSPVLVIHSPDDELIPFSHGRALFEQAGDEKELIETEGGHNDAGFLSRRKYTDAVARFIMATLEEG